MRYYTVPLIHDGFPIGNVVIDSVADKLTSLNIFTPQEAEAEADRQNEAAEIRAHWPAADDPEVLKALPGPSRLQTRAYDLHQAQEVVARQRAGLIAS